MGKINVFRDLKLGKSKIEIVMSFLILDFHFQNTDRKIKKHLKKRVPEIHLCFLLHTVFISKAYLWTPKNRQNDKIGGRAAATSIHMKQAWWTIISHPDISINNHFSYTGRKQGISRAWFLCMCTCNGAKCFLVGCRR